MKPLRPIVVASALAAAVLALAWPTSAQTPGPFSPTGSTPPNTLFFNQLNSAFGAKQDFPGLIFNTTRNGLVPQSPGGTGSFLRADGAWVPPLTTTINSTPISGGVTGRPVFDNGGVFGEYTAAQLTAYLNVFSASTQGLVPPSGGLFAGFLRADGVWIAPPLSSAIVLGQTPLTGGTSGRILFDNAGALGERPPSGNGTTVGTTSGTLTSGHCVSIDANANLVDAGAACAAGGSSTNSQLFTSSGTWTKPAGVTLVTVFECGGGGGGGGGAQQASGSTASGGAGGGAGACLTATFNAADLGATATVTVGAAGTAGAGATTTATAGGNGGNGGLTLFNGVMFAFGGGGGQGGQLATTSNGGGSAGSGSGGSGANGGTNGGQSGTAGQGANSTVYLIGGPGSGGSTGAGATAGVTTYAPGGGGSGGGITTGPAASGSGGGGGWLACANQAGAGVGTSGGAVTIFSPRIPGCGGNGGGSQLGNTGAPGAGSAGIQGGGGGGGGSVCSSGGACTAQNGGAGGVGGVGFVYITAW